MTQTSNTETKLEIERKYLVMELPEGLLEPRPYDNIRQGYLSHASSKEIRIRDKSGSFTMTIKQGEGLTRKETELVISKEQFDTLWPLTAGSRLEKRRYHVSYPLHELEIDVFEGKLKPLVLVEVEFANQQESEYFIAPDFAETEVTCDRSYNNVNLASRGLPEAYLRRLPPTG